MQLIAEKQFLDQIQQIRDRIFRVSKRILISKEEAEDATQEVILKLWTMDKEKRNSFKSIEAYSLTMTKNYCLDRLKSKQAQVTTLNEELSHRPANSLQQQLEIGDQLRWVTHLIDQLPEKERMIIQLREIEQFEYDQIATILNIPEGTVRVYLSRIRKKLKKQFLKIQSHGS